MSATYGRGQCPTCGGEFNLTKSGTMRHHNGDIWVSGWRQVCEGVGQAPKTVVASGVGSELAALRRENADLRAKLAAAVRVVSTAYPTTADEMNAVIRQISEITHVPAETVTVWSGYDDDEHWFPDFTTREAAQAYAEHRFREDCANWGNDPEVIGEISWRVYLPMQLVAAMTDEAAVAVATAALNAADPAGEYVAGGAR